MSRPTIFSIQFKEANGRPRMSTFAALTAVDLANKIRMYCGDDSVVTNVQVVKGKMISQFQEG